MRCSSPSRRFGRVFVGTPDQAAARLRELGFPVNAEDWSPDQWDAGIAPHALIPNALGLMGY